MPLPATLAPTRPILVQVPDKLTLYLEKSERNFSLANTRALKTSAHQGNMRYTILCINGNIELWNWENDATKPYKMDSIPLASVTYSILKTLSHLPVRIFALIAVDTDKSSLKQEITKLLLEYEDLRVILEDKDVMRVLRPIDLELYKETTNLISSLSYLTSMRDDELSEHRLQEGLLSQFYTICKDRYIPGACQEITDQLYKTIDYWKHKYSLRMEQVHALVVAVEGAAVNNIEYNALQHYYSTFNQQLEANVHQMRHDPDCRPPYEGEDGLQLHILANRLLRVLYGRNLGQAIESNPDLMSRDVLYGKHLKRILVTVRLSTSTNKTGHAI